jgi:uncharacterized SAM-binding protein YcdF (DUF218 family)
MRIRDPRRRVLCYFHCVQRIIRWLFWGVLLFLIVILTPISYYIGAPLREPSAPRKSDVIALFSSGQIDDQWLTADAAQRSMGALLLYRNGFAPVIVSSGSQHALGFHQAELQAEWLKRAGVPNSALIVESNSTRTYFSVIELQRIMMQHGWRSAVIVTSELDVPRIRLVCRRLGLNEVSFLAVPVERRPQPGRLTYVSAGLQVLHHAVYEYAGLVLYKVKGWL